MILGANLALRPAVDVDDDRAFARFFLAVQEVWNFQAVERTERTQLWLDQLVLDRPRHADARHARACFSRSEYVHISPGKVGLFSAKASCSSARKANPAITPPGTFSANSQRSSASE